MDMDQKQFDFEFVPAQTVSHLQQMTKDEYKNKENQEIKEKLDKDFSWLGENPLIKHDSILTAYAYGQGMNLRKEFDIPEEKLLIGDSGGYEILTGISEELAEVLEMKKKGQLNKLQQKYGTTEMDEIREQVREDHRGDINPIKVMDWFQKTNASIGMTLDHPPVRIAPGSKSQSKSISQEEFEKRAEFTAENTRKMCEYIPSEERNFALYNIIHTKIDDPKQMKLWYDKVSGYDTDGWATSPKVVDNPMYTAYILAFLHEQGVRRNVHLLGVAGLNSLPVIAYMSRDPNTEYEDDEEKGNDAWGISNLTTDSFSYGLMGLRFRKAKTPNPTMTYNSLNLPNFSFGETRDNTLHEMPCACAVCQKVNELGGADILDRGGSMPGFFMALHNLAQYKRYSDILRKLRQDEELLLKFVRKNCDEKTEKAIKFIDHAIEKNVDLAYNKYSKAFGTIDQADEGNVAGLGEMGSQVNDEKIQDTVEEVVEEEKEKPVQKAQDNFDW